MNNFELLVPQDREAALALLAEHGEEAKLIAGGTGLLNLMKQRMAFPDRLVSLHRVSGLNGIAFDDGVISVGALTRLAELERHPLIREHLPMLCSTLAEVASPRVRAMATLGGAVAHGDPHQDTPAALIALGASAVAQSASGRREIPLDTLYVDYYETRLQANELLTEIRIPRPTPTSAAVYLKFLPRSAEDYATVAAAVSIDLSKDDRRCSDCRIVVGSMGATPIRSRAAEDILIGESFSFDGCCRAAQRAAADTEPLSDTRGSATYKHDMTVVFVRRALIAAAARLGTHVKSG